MDLGLKDRVYVVTGGTRGLGLAAARELTADGARVVVSGLKVTPEAAAGVADKLGGPGQAVVMQADNADPRTPDRLINEARRAFGRLDGAFISVGGPPGGGAQSVTDEQWQLSFEMCFLGAVRLSRAVAAQLGDGGVIALVLSTSVYEPIPGLGISNAFRPALAGYAKTLAGEVGPRGIRVVGMLPAYIATDRQRELAGVTGGLDQATARIPLRRPGEPEEFGRAAAFLLSPAASFITGSMVTIDGGGRASF
jgi:3-oxoacyl-[acyl-carrier protein] reductase